MNILEILEDKIINDTYSDDEYGLYIEFKKYEFVEWSDDLCEELAHEYNKLQEEKCSEDI